jgi:hypothetical protein
MESPIFIKHFTVDCVSDYEAVVKSSCFIDQGYIDNTMYNNIQLINIIKPDGGLISSESVPRDLAEAYKKGFRAAKMERDNES